MGSEALPWVFEGEALVLWGRTGSRPVLLAALHHVGSATGPSVELVAGRLVCEPATVRGRHLPRPTLARAPLAVAARLGTPVDPAADPATVTWFAGGRRREVAWEERGMRLRAEVGRFDVPGALPVRLLVAGGRGGRIAGRLAAAHIDVDVLPGDPLATMAGRHLGVLFSTTRTAGEPLRARLTRRLEAVAEPS